MKRTLAYFILVMTTVSLLAQEPIVLKLWPSGAPNSNGLIGEEEILENGRIANVTDPTLTIYPAKNGNGTAIIACPGGGYIRLAINHEGHDMASWFNHQGITYAVLKYRMPNGKIEVPLSDAQQAIKIMRLHAEEWNINPQKIGIMGFSAGGNLASTVATHFTSETDRPDFQILFYAFMTMNPYMAKTMLGENASQARLDLYTNIKQVNKQTPPAFLICSADDKTVSYDNSILYFQALRSYGISAALHIYPSGGHGWGFNESFNYKQQWTGELAKWLSEMDKSFITK